MDWGRFFYVLFSGMIMLLVFSVGFLSGTLNARNPKTDTAITQTYETPDQPVRECYPQEEVNYIYNRV